MAILSPAEAEKLIPKVVSTKFLVRERADAKFGVGTSWCMLRCDGWKVVGWARARGVLSRDGASYVCMFENEHGDTGWCHSSEIMFCYLAVWKEMDSKKKVEVSA